MKLYFYEHIIINSPSRETITAGLGNAYQYGFALLALVIVSIIMWIRKRKKSQKK